MTIFQFMHFFVFIAYLYLAVFIVIKNPKSSLNRVCSALLVCFAIWAFGDIFIHNPHSSKNVAELFTNINSIGWISFASFILWFFLIFTEKKKILKSKIIYPLIFIPPLLFIYKQWTNSLIIEHSKESYGWGLIWSKSIWPYLFYAYYLSFIVGGLYLVLKFKKKTKEPIKKKQAGIIFSCALISLIIGSLTDVLLPELNIHTIPDVADVVSLIWGGGLVYAIVRYKFMILTPAMAADDIIFTMADSLILISPDAKILTVNQYTLDLLKYKKNELVGKPIATIFAEAEEVSPFRETRMKKLIEEGYIRDYNMTYKTKSGEKIPISFSGSVMRDKGRNLIGIVGIARDMREIKRLMQKEKELAAAAAEAAAEKKRAAELERAYKELREKSERLERFHKVTVGREMEMVKLKEEVNSLLEKLGKPKKYEAPKKIQKSENKEI